MMKESLNNKINELYNNIDAQDKIINQQTLEITRLNKDLKDACEVIEMLKKDKRKAIEYIKEDIDYWQDAIYVELKAEDFIKILNNYLEILGGKE